jgi:hypothetical protein
VVFDDASDAYWFQQQLGSSVRQYARMRCGDIDLYEYKAQPAAGVPTFRVRLASPTALAANYVLTFPGALPASTLAVQVDNTGALSFSNTFSGPVSGNTISPAAIGSGNTNNWAPVGFSGAVFIRIDATAAVGPLVTGIAAGTAGRIVHIHNISAVTIGFTNNDGSSTAANQITTPTGGTINVAQNQAISLFYDGTTTRWRITSKNF